MRTVERELSQLEDQFAPFYRVAVEKLPIY
jgi:hypothetical protein